MFDKSKRKLKSSAGESLGETLVALVIAALALLMLPQAMAAATDADMAAKKESVYYDNPDQSSGNENAVVVDSFTIN